MSGKGNSNISSSTESLIFEYLEKENIFFWEAKEEEQIFEERKYIFLHDGTGSVWVSTGWYLVVLGRYNLYMMVLGQYGAELVDI